MLRAMKWTDITVLSNVFRLVQYLLTIVTIQLFSRLF